MNTQVEEEFNWDMFQPDSGNDDEEQKSNADKSKIHEIDNDHYYKKHDDNSNKVKDDLFDDPLDSSKENANEKPGNIPENDEDDFNPDLYKNPNEEIPDYILNYQFDEQAHIDHIQALSIDNQNVPDIVRVHDLEGEILNSQKMKTDPGIGIDFLKNNFKISSKRMTTVTGIPGSGKSAFIDNIIVSMIVKHAQKVAVFSAENYPYEIHLRKLSQLILKKPFRSDNNEKISESELKDVIRLLDDKLFFIPPRENGITLTNILDVTKTLIGKYSINILVIDPWNEIQHLRTPGLTETEYVSKVLSDIRGFARKYDIHVFIVAHPTKLQKLADGSGQYPVPEAYDISGSAAWYNKSDNIISIVREPTTNQTNVYIKKVRFEGIDGRKAKIKCTFNPQTGKITHIT